MAKFVCSRCYREFKRKSHLQYHLNRKRPCKVVSGNIIVDDDGNIDVNDICNELGFPSQDPKISSQNSENSEKPYVCKYCKRSYKHNHHLTRHHKTCKEKKEYEATFQEIYNKLMEKLQEHELQMMEHENKIQELSEENKMLKNSIIQTGQIITNTDNSVTTNNTTNNTNNTTNNGTINNTVNIQINALGHENTDYLTTKDKVEIVEKMHKSIITYIEKIHFNPDHPENHNVYVQNLKNSYGAMFNGNRWETRHIADIVEFMMDYSRNKIEEIREELNKKGKVRNYVEGRLDELFNAIDGDTSEASKNIMKVTEERIKFLAFDRRHVVKKTKDLWTKNHAQII